MFQKVYKFRFCLALIVTTALVFGCSKSNTAWLYYDETNCLDKWESNMNNELLKNNVVSYMDTRGVKVLEIEIFSDREKENCTECSCKTGRRIKCKVKKRDIKAIKREGFY
jgi:hypothetical protein